MQHPPRIMFVDLPVDDEMEALIEEKIGELEKFYSRITSCRVAVSLPHRHKRQGNLVAIHIDIHVPGTVLVVDREPAASQRDENWRVAVHDAFDRARRQVEEFSQKIRGDEKTHDLVDHVGRIKFTRPFENYGFITTEDDREIYFHRHAVADDRFDELDPGDEVRFREEEGENGPQATVVTLLRHRPPMAG